MVQSMADAALPLALALNSLFSHAAPQLDVEHWTSIQINRNCVSEWHVDTQSHDQSMLMSLGDYEAGEFDLQGCGK